MTTAKSTNENGVVKNILETNIPPPAPFNLHESTNTNKTEANYAEGIDALIENAQGELRTVDLHQQRSLDDEDETTFDLSMASSVVSDKHHTEEIEKPTTKMSSAQERNSKDVQLVGKDGKKPSEGTEKASEKGSKVNQEKEKVQTENRTTNDIEILRSLEAEDQNRLADSMPSYQNASTKTNQFSRNSSNIRGNRLVLDNDKETIQQSDKRELKIAVGIQDQRDRLLSTGNTDHEDDYGSDDTTSTTSSIEDETMPGLEEVSFPLEAMSGLAEPDFDVWRLGRDAMVDHLEYMYHDLGVTRAWRIPRTTLRMFLLGVRERYQDNPYHNFKHCFCVTQMAYSMVCKLKLRHLLSVDDLGMLLTGAICHDVDHPGLNNGYHTHAHTPLAILYNYQSILEQHHFAVTCRILTNKERNIFRNVPNRDDILNGARELILATDLALHKDIMEQYRRNIAAGFDFKNRSHVLSLLKIIIKCADVSNEVRPESIATPWVELLFSEYYEQSAREKRERLPLTAYMDPEQVDVTESQYGFIRGMMLPMYTELGNLVVEAKLYYVNPLREALIRYELQKRNSSM